MSSRETIAFLTLKLNTRKVAQKYLSQNTRFTLICLVMKEFKKLYPSELYYYFDNICSSLHPTYGFEMNHVLDKITATDNVPLLEDLYRFFVEIL